MQNFGKQMLSIGFEVLTVVTMRSTIFWVVKPPMFHGTIKGKVIFGHN
jgi:hypothetical protein